MAPSNEYLLFEAQPPSTILYTPTEDMARKNNRPTFKSATTIVGVNGTITKLINTVATTTAGAAMKTHLSANGGIQSSLKNNLSVSAKTIKIPSGPARLGPSLS